MSDQKSKSFTKIPRDVRDVARYMLHTFVLIVDSEAGKSRITQLRLPHAQVQWSIGKGRACDSELWLMSEQKSKPFTKMPRVVRAAARYMLHTLVLIVVSEAGNHT